MKNPRSKREVAKIARYLGCRGVHKGESGEWMPCADHATLMRLSAEAETDKWLEKTLNAKTAKNNYTKPKLRESIKRRIMAGSRGGKPGQWSARKAQLVAIEYRKAGGGYRGKRNKKQRSLKKWTSEKWTTSDGKPAIRAGGTRRYLPAKAWRKLTPAQRRATNRKKITGSRQGRQFVSNTEAAARARRAAVKSANPSVIRPNLTMERFSEMENRSPKRRKRGKRWEKLAERGPIGIDTLPSGGIVSAPIVAKFDSVSKEVKESLRSLRKE